MNSNEYLINGSMLTIRQTNIFDEDRSNRFVCIATTGTDFRLRNTTVFVIGGQPLLIDESNTKIISTYNLIMLA